MKKHFIVPEIDFINLFVCESIMTEQIFLSGNSFSNDGINFIDSEVINDDNFWEKDQSF